MPRLNVALYGFNHGEISRHALGRVDVERLRLAAETQVNWMPLALGPMMLRPGMGYLGSTKSDAVAHIEPFVFANDDTAMLEFTALVMRVWVDDALLAVVSASTTVTNGDFSSGTGWTLTATSGASATISGGKLNLHALALGSSAFCERSVSVAGGDQNKVHRLRVVVDRGPVTFQLGSSSGGEQIIGRTTLGTGTHSLAFTPGVATIYPRLSTMTKITKVVDSIQIESSGTFELPTPWTADDLSLLRPSQSGDIIYVACDGYQPRQIERRDNNSWSICLFEQTGGPYTAKPSWASQVSMDPLQLAGGTSTIASSVAYFTSDHVNSLIALDMSGQSHQERISAANFYSQAFEVTGVTAADRTFTWTLTDTWTATVTLQRSTLGEDGGFIEIQDETANSAYSLDDSADFANISAWYRVGIQPTEYTSGVVNIGIEYAGGVSRGQARIIAINSSTEAQIEIIDTFENGNPSLAWRVGSWSTEHGWPSASAFYDGRLWYGGRDEVWGSASDDFLNFDETDVTDAGPISRSFGEGTFDKVNWMLPLQRLIVGRGSACVSIRSSSFDAPLTPTDFTMKPCAGGVANIAPVAVDSRGIYVDKSGRRVYELAFNVESGDYKPRDLTRLNLDIGDEGFVEIAVQRQPDTRLHFIRGDGVGATLTYDADDEVEAWWRIETDGEIESVCVLPGDLEDRVYFVVKRTINGQTKRYIERMARMDECIGAAINKLADSFIEYSGVSTATISGLGHLEGEEVVVWGASKDLGNYTVASGSITLSQAVTYAVIGLEYEARFMSAKLPYAAKMGSALTQEKKIGHIGLIITDTHYQGLEFGQSFDRMDNLPLVVGGATVAADTIWEQYDNGMQSLPGTWQTDSRLCLRATAPRPATVNACVIGIETHEKP